MSSVLLMNPVRMCYSSIKTQTVPILLVLECFLFFLITVVYCHFLLPFIALGFGVEVDFLLLLKHSSLPFPWIFNLTLSLFCFPWRNFVYLISLALADIDLACGPVPRSLKIDPWPCQGEASWSQVVCRVPKQVWCPSALRLAPHWWSHQATCAWVE